MSPSGSSRKALFLGAAALLLLVQLGVRACVLADQLPITEVEAVELGRAYAFVHRSECPDSMRTGPPACSLLLWAPVLWLSLPAEIDLPRDPAPVDALALGRQVLDALPEGSRLVAHTRVLSVILFLVLAIVLSRTTTVRTGAECALIAICWVALDGNLIRLFSLAAPYALLALLLTLGLLAFSRYLARRSQVWCAIASLLLALAALTRFEVLFAFPALAAIVVLALARAKLPDCMDLPLPLAMRAQLGIKHVSRYLALEVVALVVLSSMTGSFFLSSWGDGAVPRFHWLACLPALLALPIFLHVWIKQELYPHGHHLLTVGVAVPLAIVALVRGQPSLATLVAMLPLLYTCLADFLGRRFEMSHSARGWIVTLLALHGVVHAFL